MSGTILRRRLVFLLVLSLIAGVAYAVYTLRIDEIRVSGVRTLDPKVVIERSGLRGGERILWVRLSAVARRLEEIPAIASARAERSFPATIVIHVTERTPIARLPGQGGLGVDENGRVFSSSALSGLPVVEGVRGPAKEGVTVDRGAATVLDAFAGFPAELRKRTAGIVVGPPLTLLLADGTEIRFGSHIDLVRKATVAEAILRTETGNELAYVDVRSPGVPVSRQRDAPSPQPTPSTSPARPAAPPGGTP